MWDARVLLKVCGGELECAKAALQEVARVVQRRNEGIQAANLLMKVLRLSLIVWANARSYQVQQKP